MRTLQKLQNSIQTLLIFWPVYPIHINSLFWVIFVELPFCHFPPPNTSIRGKDPKIQLIFHLNILVFQTNGKQPYFFPVLSRFCNGLSVLFFFCRFMDLHKPADKELNQYEPHATSVTNLHLYICINIFYLPGLYTNGYNPSNIFAHTRLV